MDSKLNEGQRKQLMTLISKYQDTFSSNPGLTDQAAIKIETGMPILSTKFHIV